MSNRTRPLFLAFTCLPLLAGAVLAGEAGGEIDEDFITPREREKLRIEQEKLRAEREKLRAEQKKLRIERERRAAPVLGCRPSLLRASVTKGGTAPLRLTVRNLGGQTLSWSIQQMPKWLTAEERSGKLGFKSEQIITLVVDPQAEPGGLPGGPTRSKLILAAPGAGRSPLTVPLVVEMEGPSPPPPIEEEPPPSPGDLPRAVRPGIRTGFLAFTSAERGGIDSTALVGFFLGPPKTRGISWEAGLDLASVDAENGSYSSRVYVGRFDVLFPLGGGPDGDTPRAKPYLLSGVDGIVESAEEADAGFSNYATAINLGVGVGLKEGKFDLRATYSVLLGSDNSSGMMLLTGAFTF